jgi:hypothetical protein
LEFADWERKRSSIGIIATPAMGWAFPSVEFSKGRLQTVARGTIEGGRDLRAHQMTSERRTQDVPARNVA